MSSPNPNNCIVCGNERFRDIPYPGSLSNSLGIYGIRICSSCGLGIASPMPPQDALDKFYQSGDYWHSSGESQAQLAHERNQSRHRVLRCLKYFAAQGSVADIGAGHGLIAEWLYRLIGERVLRYDFIEPDAINRQEILARHACFAIKGISSIAELSNDYALIFVNHVIEHVADPVEFLGGVCARLQPGGIVYIETPHADYRFKDDVFPHTLFFTPAALQHLATRLGLEVIECGSFGAYPGTPSGMNPRLFRWASISFHFAARARFGPMERWLDDAIWQYQPKTDGMWLRCVLRRPPK